MDMTGGPTWMFYEPLLNGAMAVYVNGQEYDPEGTMADRIFIGKLIDASVESDDVLGTVTFKLLFRFICAILADIEPNMVQHLSEAMVSRSQRRRLRCTQPKQPELGWCLG